MVGDLLHIILLYIFPPKITETYKQNKLKHLSFNKGLIQSMSQIDEIEIVYSEDDGRVRLGWRASGTGFSLRRIDLPSSWNAASRR